MSASNSYRKKGSRIKNNKAWIWMVVPVFLILAGGYLFYRNYYVPHDIPESAAETDSSGTVPPGLPVSPEAGSPEAPVPAAPEEYKLFFGNEDFNSSLADCDDLFPVFRDGKKVEDIISKSLTELLKGPTETEAGQGYYTSINPGVRILGIRKTPGTVYADFSRELEDGVAGSCQTMAIRAQINETLLQFEGIDKVVILVEGKPGSVLQP